MDDIKYKSLTDLDAKLTFIIGGIEYQHDEFNEFVMISAQYHELIIRITFTKKHVSNDEFKINSRHILINNKIRSVLEKTPVITVHNKYYNRVCGNI